MKTKELLAKADIALGDLASGGLMLPEQQNRFIRILSEDTNFLRDVRIVQMQRAKMNINKLDLATRALRVANQGIISSPLAGEQGTRALSRADRVKITTTKVELDTYEVIAEVNIPYEVLEDTIEGGQIDNTQFEETVLTKLGERVRRDIEDVMLNGDVTNVVDSFLAARDGVLVQTTSNIVNNGGAPIDAILFNEMIQALPDKFKPFIDRYKFYVAHNRSIQYQMQVAQRQTGLGDSVLTGGSAKFAPFGVPLIGAASMPSDKALLIDPNNVIFGIQRGMRMEFDKDVRERVLIIVLTMRFDFKLEQENMVVKAINIG